MKGTPTADGLLVLDSHKLGFHLDRVDAWESGEQIVPVSVDMALTRACGAMCSFCYAMVQEDQTRLSIDTSTALRLAEDFAELGVRGVSLVSDGESTLSKAYVPFVKKLFDLGIDVGNATNGWEWGPEKIEEVLPSLTWVRFTVAAGNPDSYARIMYKGPENTHVFERAMKHIRYAVELKRRLNLKTTLGIQMVLTPELESEIVPFARLAAELGVDYGVIKHCSDDESGSLGIDYSRYESLFGLLREAESMSTDRTKIIVKWDKIQSKGIPPYKRYYAPQFLLQLSGSGLVAPAGMFFNAKFSKFHIGNFVDQPFIEIFKSSQYRKVMTYLASKYFDARTMMGTLPIGYYVNVALNDHLKGTKRIEECRPGSALHHNFL